MATERAGPPEGFTTVSAPQTDNDYDTEEVGRPQVGDLLQGDVLAKKPGKGEYESMVVELKLTQPYGEHEVGDLVHFWCTSGLEDLMDEIDRGREIAVYVDELDEIDGEEVRLYEIGVGGGDNGGAD